jgi:hypothetical protein
VLFAKGFRFGGCASNRLVSAQAIALREHGSHGLPREQGREFTGNARAGVGCACGCGVLAVVLILAMTLRPMALSRK